MNSKNDWSALFSESSFFCLKKDDKLNTELCSKLNYPEIENFHPGRKNEFLLGRLCASRAHQLHFGTELLSLPINPNRSPAWPSGVIGSISHNQFWVGAAVSKTKSLLGVGIDFEVMGRTKLELGGYIRSAEDLKTHPSFNETELLTLIFSAKESLYKALSPTVQSFFGFEAAALREINIGPGSFKIDLVSEISPGFGPNHRFHFEGRFMIFENNCLTVLEIPN